MQLYRPNVTFFESDTLLYQHAVSYLSDILLDISGNEGVARLAVSGGSTPLPLYQGLANNPVLPWEQIELYQVDERYVPLTDPENNQQMIRRSFGEETIQRMKETCFFRTEKNIEDTLEEYEEILTMLENPLFDVSVLGIGADGHFASLFPGGEYLRSLEDKVIATQAGHEYDTNQRLSLTVETVLSSETIVVLLKGEVKQNVVQELLEGKKSAANYPAKFLLSHPNLHIFQSMEGLE